MENLVHVATIVVAEDNFECMYRNLRSALAPLGFDVVGIIQEANYQKTFRPNSILRVADFISMVNEVANKYKSFKDNVSIETDLEYNEIRVYASKAHYKKSTYASTDFRQKVYKSELPIVFRNEEGY